MARIKRSNTKPELIVRSMLHRLGYRFRLQLGKVPGRPDVGFPKRKKAVFVHGCFWHGHENCKIWRIPKSHSEFWSKKIEANRARDQRLQAAAEQDGWQCFIVWECETRDTEKLSAALKIFLGPSRLSSLSE